jgi:hypothetical protein
MSAVLPSSATPEVAESDAEDESQATSAAQRLAQSRERLRQWMMRGDGRHEARRRAAAAEAEGERPALLDRLRSMRGVGVVVDAVAAWWWHHPLHPAASLAQGVVQERVAPLARRHPLIVLAAAFVAGAALVRFKPWRWIAKPALFGGLLSHIASHAVAQFPFESVLGAITSFTHSRTHDDQSDLFEPADAAARRSVERDTVPS